LAAALVSTTPLATQDISINLGQGGAGGLDERIIQLITLLTVLSLAPSILVMKTSLPAFSWCCRCCAPHSAPQPRRRTRSSLATFLTAIVIGRC
jgi:flagellar biosynthesis protein FliP